MESDPRGPRIRAGFTLIEMLVVIGIISLIILLVIPALWSGRKSAKAAVGTANMRGLTQVMMNYTNDNQEYYLSPFRKEWPLDFPGGQPLWTMAVCEKDPALRWNIVPEEGAPGDKTEGFETLWASYLSDYRGTARVSQDQFSPADGDLLDAYQDVKDTPEMRSGSKLFPSSFKYAVCFWTKPDRYSEEDKPPALMTADMLRNNQTSSVKFPRLKVMIWSQDFLDRPKGTPSLVHASMADGSYRAINMGSLGDSVLSGKLSAPALDASGNRGYFSFTVRGVKGQDVEGNN
jgi:prepilin-type N-terminal cleavage/methylation domain-containing protein